MKDINEALATLIKELNDNQIVSDIKKIKQALPEALVLKLKDNNLSIEARKDIIFSNDSLIKYNQLLNELNLIILGINHKLKLIDKHCGNCK